MRAVAIVLLIALACGLVHAHEACEDDPCLRCVGSDSALVADCETTAISLAVAAACSLEPAAPTTARSWRLPARAPPVAR